ncbi:MAG: ATP-binding cassette domain-containing protein [Crocinitomicaceae bacterium]
MSERILRALMQLFAIIAKVDEVQVDVADGDFVPTIKSSKGIEIIESFLKSELSSSDVNRYLSVFENFLNETRGKLFSKRGGDKRTSLQAVKVLRICSQINEELTQRQKMIVLVRILEFINSDNVQTEKEQEFVQTVADAFNVSKKEYDALYDLTATTAKELIDKEGHFYYIPGDFYKFEKSESSIVDGLDEPIHVVNIESVNTVFFRYYGLDELIINGQIVSVDKTYLFNIGSTVRTSKSNQIYYSDLISKISQFDVSQELTFTARNILHSFGTNQTAIRRMSFSTNSGNMIGIMGGSGAGKTTLMNVFNGKVKPTYGNVEINGIDLHNDSKNLQGLIGNVSQNDLLIEELTVFENLYFAAKLSMGGESSKQITHKVVRLLSTIGLYEAKDLKVGSPLEKVISGGQRKRLNIALELIRNPQILFVDEPTSGLSSKDSENIMDLLKELSLRGTLVFVVIHQPSSTIFKLFDRLLIMDQGGHLVYDGIPLNALVHFKTHSFQGNAHERECGLCGNVNPEQIFNIIDRKIVDEFGNETVVRKKSAEDWHLLYLTHKEAHIVNQNEEEPEISTKLPSRLKQFTSYLIRDFLSKISNKQYLIINGLISPILALVLSFFTKYFANDKGHSEYSFYTNENIPQYIFICVIVAIFIGLVIAAEEINKDKKILARERFLNLSRNSYLLSKVTILFFISAIQSLMFVLIANSILEIKGMYVEYWLVLFSTSCLANLAGLNISSAFNSAKVIYIIVPLLVIPQLLFSGVIVKFDKLHPSLSNATKVPWVGNVMASRWAYEALAVEQASNNPLETYYFDAHVRQSSAKWKKDYWLPEIRRNIRLLHSDEELDKEEVAFARDLVYNEMEREISSWNQLSCEECLEKIKTGERENDFKEVNGYLKVLEATWRVKVNKRGAEIQNIIEGIGTKKYIELRDKYTNESLMNLITNKLEDSKMIISDGKIYQNDEPIFNIPSKESSFFSAHFYAPKKFVFGNLIDTYWINVILIWTISLLTYVALYFDWLRKFIKFAQRISSRLSGKKKSNLAD